MSEEKDKRTPSSSGLATQDDSNRSVSKAGFDDESVQKTRGDDASKKASQKSGNNEGLDEDKKSDGLKKTKRAAEMGAQAGDAGVKAFNLLTTINFLKNM